MLELTLLGGIAIRRDGAPIPRFRSQTEMALLAFLAHTGRVHQREMLADLLWEARTTKQSLSNLRTLLTRLRKRVGEALVVTRKTVALTDATVDSVRFVQLVEGESRFEAGLALYGGALMDGVYLANAPRFNDWLVVEQERLRQIAVRGFQQWTQKLATERRFAAGAQAAHRWVALDPFDERAQRQLMQLLAQGGQSRAALTQYDQCAALLAVELDVVPELATTALAAQIRQGKFAAPVQRRETPNNLPRELTAFFGRSPERTHITQQIASPNHPLITLTGEGGIGKTRLAIAVARQLLTTDHPFEHGIWFVPLANLAEDATVREAVATAIGTALGMFFHGKRSPSVQLLAYLEEKSACLILDNFEQIAMGDAVDLLIDLLQAAPRVQVVVTSRVALELNSETVVRLSGLPVPEGADEDAVTYDSVQLFAERAARKSSGFDLHTQLEAVVTICQLVEGLPLALELAAAAVSRHSCAVIAANLHSYLHARQRDLPSRQRSMRAVFDYSWQLLEAQAQQILAQLTIFRGGFTEQSARLILDGADVRLNHLVRQSMLQRSGNGRYRIHPLIGSFLTEKLENANRLFARHCDHYLQMVAQMGADSPLTVTQLHMLTTESDNIRHAWQWASANGYYAPLQKSVWGLLQFYMRRALFEEGEVVFRQSAERITTTPLHAHLQAARLHFLVTLDRGETVINFLEATDFTAWDAPIQARLQLAWGNALYRQAQYEPALAHYESGLARAKTPAIKAKIHRAIGSLAIESDRYEMAHTHNAAALALFRQRGDLLGEANTLTGMGWLAQREGNLDEALQLDQQAYERHLAAENPHGVAMTLINMAIVHGQQGAFSQAYRCRQEVSRHLEQIDDRYQRALHYHGLGVLLSRLGDYDNALAAYERSTALDRAAGDTIGLVWTWLNIGLAHNHRGQFAAALEIHREALRVSQAVGVPLTEGLAQLRIGQDLFGLGRLADALQAFRAAHAQFTRLDHTVWGIEAVSGLARVQFALGERGDALASAEIVLTHLATATLNGAREPLRVYWNCYRLLHDCADPRADDLLAKAHARLMASAERIDDPNQRQSYLHNVPFHREIMGSNPLTGRTTLSSSGLTHTQHNAREFNWN